MVLNGWAQDEAYPHAPVCLDVVVDGAIVALAYADLRRKELDGHGFSLRLPGVFAPTSQIVIRRSADHALLADARGLEREIAA